MTDARPSDGARIDPEDVLDVLARGELEVRGRLLDASNATLYAVSRLDGVELPCVYKPVAGERPLWDFPSRTLARREVAAYLLGEATGWDVVPPTCLRAEGPFGPGSVQRWVGPFELDADGDPVVAEPGAGLVDVRDSGDVPEGWLLVLRVRTSDEGTVHLVHADDPALRRMAVFDAVANNADRKGGHVLRGADGGVLGIDHGLTFHEEDKLRTVLWGWAGRRLPEETLEVLRALAVDLDGHGPLRRALRELLSPGEVDRTLARVHGLLSARRHPRPGAGHHPIPWPAF